MSKILHAILAVALIAPALAFAELPVKSANGVLVNGKGMTLYTFDKDTGGNSKCNSTCATNWPPFINVGDGATGDAAGGFTLTTRADGLKQWAYKGKPLYAWAKDQKPGDKTGDGVGGVWHVATP